MPFMKRDALPEPQENKAYFKWQKFFIKCGFITVFVILVPLRNTDLQQKYKADICSTLREKKIIYTSYFLTNNEDIARPVLYI